ncbi:hypothetical protein [Halomonas sp. hl-4]|uniref:hypothetical protein n=1 Tax=Halomonas sp. hl-4 TaxID=1761789 RepID=UPI000BB7B4B5|nr:hypothetical protein [Halomonas sp. hl-4]SNY95682.1 hypothetical protein SAMN04488142_0190 [Halomonas sp. hl-4]
MSDDNHSQKESDLNYSVERKSGVIWNCFLGIILPVLPHLLIILWLYNDSSRSGSWAGMLIFPFILIGLMPTLVINIIWTAATFEKKHSEGMIFLRGILVSMLVPFLLSPFLFGLG